MISWINVQERTLEFISIKHIRFLEKFNFLFKQFDRDKDGRLTEKEFRAFVKKIEVITNKTLKVDKLLMKLDPGNTQYINYSGIVFVLSNEFLDLSESDFKESEFQQK